MAFSQQKSINLDIQIADSIRIITWNKSEVYAKASIDINDNKDNEVYVTNFEEKGSSIEVKQNLMIKRKSATMIHVIAAATTIAKYIGTFIFRNNLLFLSKRSMAILSSRATQKK
jgi:hypothetical protein